MRALKNVHIPFMKYRNFYFLISSILIIAGIYSFITRGLNYGIDFSGGTQVILKYKDPITVDTLNNVRKTLSSMDLGDVIVHDYGSRDDKGNLYSLLARVELSSEETQAGTEKTKSEGTDIAELITDKLKTEEDRTLEAQGKIDLNSTGKLKIEDYLKASGYKPASYPDYLDQFVKDKQSGDTELALTEEEKSKALEEKFDKFLATAIINYRELADVGIIRNFNELKKINSEAEYIAANGNKPVNLITDDLLEMMSKDFFLGSFTVIGVEMVGPSVGQDLRDATISAIIFALIGILIYITIRFQFRFGIAAIIALVHDVTITVGIFAISGKEFTLTIVAAILTIVGYSLNDTIVVSDRIRENLNKLRRESFTDVVNISINETLSRTILTSLTTLFVVVCILFLGGEVLNGFAFALFVGIVVGTYSSICVVSPILVIWQKFNEKYKKQERGSEYVKRSLKTLFPDQQAKPAITKNEAKENSEEDSEEAKAKAQSRKKSKKGITGKKKKRKRR